LLHHNHYGLRVFQTLLVSLLMPHTCDLIAAAKEPCIQQVLGPHNAMNGLVRCVAQGAYWVRFWGSFGGALKALSLALKVHRDL
jgi:hypothetical protein